jgi:hypothetical protein
MASLDLPQIPHPPADIEKKAGYAGSTPTNSAAGSFIEGKDVVSEVKVVPVVDKLNDSALPSKEGHSSLTRWLDRKS